MNWDNLRVFLAVARTGSLSAGAKQLNVQHSTVSRRLRSFEEELGVRLLDRKRDGCEATPAGLELEAIARRMEQEMLALDSRVAGREGRLEGPLEVSTADAMAVTFLMPMFAEFSQLHPDITVHVSVCNDYVRLGEREADIAIRATSSPPETLIGNRVSSIAFAVYGRRDVVETARASGTNPRWISASGGMPHQGWIHARTASAKLALVVDEAVLTQAALREGLGVALMPCFQGDPDPLLTRFEGPIPEASLDLWLLIHKDLRQTQRVRVFRDFMAERIRGVRDLLEGRGFDSSEKST